MRLDDGLSSHAGLDSCAIVHVCRHGLVENPQQVLYGRLPGYHLSAVGRAMAERLGEHFAAYPLQHLRTSPLERAQETMAPIAARHTELPVQVDWRLIEADSYMQGQGKGPFSLRMARPANWHYYLNPARPSWGEGFTAMGARVLAAIADAGYCAGPGGQAVLVSHQAPIWAARRLAEHKFVFNFPAMRQCALASVTTFAVDLSGRPGASEASGVVRFVSYADIMANQPTA